jgi:GTPase SAR1 family protein
MIGNMMWKSFTDGRLRPLSYAGTDIFLIIFSVGNRESFESVAKRWIPELDHFVPNSRKILIGTQTELRQSLGKNAIRTKEGIELAKSIGACGYFELSSKFNRGLKEPLEFAAKLGTCTFKKSDRKNDRKICLIQ